jgi:hypothetical protein
VAYFSAEEAPVSVGLVLDFSSSMAPRFGQLQQAVAEFLKSPNPQDEFCLIEFRDRAELSMGFTSAAEEIQNRVASTQHRAAGCGLSGSAADEKSAELPQDPADCLAQRKFDKLEAAAETLQRAEASGRRIKHEQFAADVEASPRRLVIRRQP